MRKASHLEMVFERTVDMYLLPQPVREFRFHRYRFDFAWPSIKVAIEIDGGTYHGGHHVRGHGYRRDCEKNNLAQLEGWVVLRADREMVCGPHFGPVVKKMIQKRIHERTGRK